MTEKVEKRICEVGGGGIFLPAFGDAEQEWPAVVRIILYFFGMLWFFLGVGIVSDIFMEGIEVITATEKQVRMKDGSTITVKVWNATIANLTLMALGSSAPEILLNVIEIFNNKFYAGALGPSTIVGSAAFNLMCIIGVCVSAPCPDKRIIADLHVFGTTAFFSIFAYVWLLIILQASSPDVVTLPEALITFILFPVLASLAFAADKNYCTTKIIPTASHLITEKKGHHPLSKETYIRNGKQMDISADQAHALIADYKANHGVSRAQLKKQALAQVTGGKKHIVKDRSEDIARLNEYADKKLESGKSEFNWEAAAYHCVESDGFVELFVIRDNADEEQTVDFKTVEGSATKNQDYEHTEGTVKFEKGVFRQSVKVKIIDDDEVEEDEEFIVSLSNACPPESCKVGSIEQATVVIIDDDEPGQLGFRPEDAKVRCYESSGHVDIFVSRMNGTQGELRCKFTTVEDTAKAGKDFIQTESEEIVFGNGEVKKKISIKIIDGKMYEKDEVFKVVLSDIVGPVSDITFHDIIEAEVTITADPQVKRLADSIEKLLDDPGVDIRTFADQFKACLSPEVEDGETATAGDWFGHILALPFKILFATIPPPHIMGGKACFIVALAYIGLVTAFIGDIAGLFGCVLDLDDSVTAITFVALGTSLPDTFASKAAAIAEETADAAVGNVTGSNSVNVFLGLGLPWCIAALAWSKDASDEEMVKWSSKYPDLVKDYPKGAFAVPAGALGFSVTVFSICAVTTIGTLCLRRKLLGCELGGDKKIATKTSIFMWSLWFIYVFLSSLQAYGHIG